MSENKYTKPEQIWLRNHSEYNETAVAQQQSSGRYHIYMYTDRAAKPRKTGRLAHAYEFEREGVRIAATMQKIGEALRFSASDLVGHVDCHHLTALDAAVARGELERPRFCDPLLVSRHTALTDLPV